MLRYKEFDTKYGSAAQSEFVVRAGGHMKVFRSIHVTINSGVLNNSVHLHDKVFKSWFE